MFGAIADEQHEIIRVANVILQMMPDASCFGHARGADDNGRLLQIVEFHGMRHFADVGQVLHAEGIGLFPQEPVDGVVEAFRVQTEDFRGIHAQGAIDKDGHLRQCPGERQLMERIDNLLGSPDRKRGDDDLPLARQGFAHQAADLGVGGGLGTVLAPSVRAFNLKVINRFHRLRIAQNIILAPSDIAAEQIPKPPALFANVQTTCAEPKMWPASRKVTVTPSATGMGRS